VYDLKTHYYIKENILNFIVLQDKIEYFI